MADANRQLTVGEIAMLRSVFKDTIQYDKVRIHSERWAFVFPGDRAMAPNGEIYFPGATYEADFAAATVSLARKAVFIHEGTHLYQWYGLGQTVWARGPFDRNYDYALVPGRTFQEYGLEQMGMIAEHYYTLLHRGRIGLPYTLADYQAILPVGR
jgi:hypothetical protein